MAENTEEKPASGVGPDPVVLEKIAESQKIPTPMHCDDWIIETSATNEGSNRRFFGLLKKKELSDELVTELRRSAVNAPGNTLIQVKKLEGKFPANSTLLMISAICQQGMVLNSSNQIEVIKGLKTATKDAATSLLNGGINLYNVENFLKIYFTYLDRLKKNQGRIFQKVRHDTHLASHREVLQNSVNMVDYLFDNKKKTSVVLSHMKKKIKTSDYTTFFDFSEISRAMHNVENGMEKEKLTLGTSKEVVAFVYALCVAFARVPILDVVLDEVLDLFTENNTQLYLRKISIRSTRHFTRYRLFSQEGNSAKMKQLGKQIYNENSVAITKLEGKPITQGYESDPFFNLAIIAEIVIGVFEPNVHGQMVNAALKAMEAVTQRDKTKQQSITETAKKHFHKLTDLKKEIRG